MKKRMISLALALCMLLSIMPITAFATESTDQQQEQAVTETAESQPVESVSDASESSEDETDASQPSEGETDASQPSEGETDASQPSEEETDASQPSEGETDASQPSEGETDASQPSEGETDASQPSEGETDESQPSEGETDESQPTEEEIQPDEDEDDGVLGKNDAIDGTVYHVTSVKNYDIAPGISEKIVITNNETGTSQTVANVMEIDLSSGYAKLAAGYGNRNPSAEGWTMKTTTDQAHLYENTYGENVVGGINASLFNITSGEPMGYLVMKGVTHKNNSSFAFVGIFSDNSVGLFPAGTSLEAATAQQSAKQGTTVELVDAIAGWMVLVDGETVSSTGSNGGYYSRSAIGLKEDGSVVLLQADGTMAPRSQGYTIEEMGRMMQALGCVYALELDEGGSATYVSQREGEDDVTMRNTPAGGSERVISTSILVVSTAPSNGEFNHANITPNEECYTPNSVVELTAEGIDYSGAVAGSIPETITWELASGYEGMGSVAAGTVSGNTATATFTSNGTIGDVVINMVNDGEVVGTAQLSIQHPDALAFTADEINLIYGESSDLGLVAKHQGQVVNLKAGDITWAVTGETEEAAASAGTFDGNYFVVTSDKQVSVSVTITASYGELSDSISANVGKQPAIVMDGGDEDVWDYSNIGTTVESFTGMAADAVATYHYAGRGGIVTGSIVTDSDEEYADIVRFGHNAIKLEYDWTGLTGNDGACLGLGSALEVNGTPTAIGVWVYIPEGVPVPWLRAQIATSSDGTKWTNAYINFTLGSTEDNLITGWQYLEADLTNYAGMQIRINSGMLFRAMAGASTGFGWYTVDGVALDKSQLKGYIILDNIQFVYGANNQDVTLPRVTGVQLINDDSTKTDLENGAVLNSNSLNFYVTYDDNENTDEFATGIESAYFYLDGVYYGEGTKDNLGSTLAGIALADGEHSLTFYLKDGFGNVTRETRYFTVDTSSSYTNVSLEVSADPMVAETWKLNLNTNHIADLASVETTIALSRGYAVTGVEFADGVTGTYTYKEAKGTVEIVISEIADTASGELLATVLVDVPASTKEGAAISVQVTKGTYTTDGTAEYWKGFSTQAVSCTVGAAYRVVADPLVVGLGTNVTVTDAEGNAVEGVNVYYGEGTLLGATAADGKVSANVLTESANTYSVYALDDSGNRSYPITVTSYTATGAESGAPYYIINNVAKDPATQQNISWMSNPLYAAETAQAKLSTSQDMADAVTVAGTSNVVSYSKSGTSNRANGVVFTGLTPNTTYYYQVGDGSVWSEVGTFTTASANDRTTSFFILADIQEEGALAGMGRIATHLASGSYDFGLQTGDAVDNVRYYEQWADALDLFSLDGVHEYDMIHVVGNHEDDDDGNNAYATKSIFNLDGDWYSVEYGEVYVAVLNHATSEEELAAFGEWLAADAAASDCAWKIVATHVPVYTTNPGGQNANYLNQMPGILESAGIDFYFCGDAHSYSRTAPVTGGSVDEDNGVVYYICGSTGGKSYSVVDTPEYNFEVATIDFESVYMDVVATKYGITITAYNVDSNGNATVLDTYYKGAVECENEEHTYAYEHSTDTLICTICGSEADASDSMYVGWAVDYETGSKMFFTSGKYLTGYVSMNQIAYYFDENGVVLNGEYTIGGETCLFVDGVYTSCSTADVLLAGWCGIDTYGIEFVMYADNTFVMTGSGAMMNYQSSGAVPWRSLCAKIVHLQIDPRITTIGKNGFCFAYALESIDFGENSQLTTIGYRAFHYLKKLYSLTLPDSVTTIGWHAFGYSSLQYLYLPDGVKSIDETAFNQSTKLTLGVAEGTYAHNFAVEHNIPVEVRAYVPKVVASGSCGENATWTLYESGEFVISGSGAMTDFGRADMPWNSYKQSILSVVVGKDITHIGNYSFGWCYQLESVTFEEGSVLESVGTAAFHFAKKLTTVELPETVKSLGYSTFGYSAKLTYVYMPTAISSIDKDAFLDTSNVTLSVALESYAHKYALEHGINVQVRHTEGTVIASGDCGENAQWTLYDNGTFLVSGSGAMYDYGRTDMPWNSLKKSITKIVIGKDITHIGNYAFGWCYQVTEVVFNEGSVLQSIGTAGLHYLRRLTSITLPDSVTTLGYCALGYAAKLTYVYMPDGVSSIDKEAFLGTSNVTLDVAKDTYAHRYAVDHGINVQVREYVATVIASGQCGENATWTLYDTGLFEVSGSGAMYDYGRTAMPWNSLKQSITKIVIGKDITHIGNYAFGWCYQVTEVAFEEGSVLESVGTAGFHYMRKLTTITLPESVTALSYCALGYGTNLTYVYLPAGLTSIDKDAFMSSSKVTLDVADGSYAHQFALANGIAVTVR